jgi:hypothetical protein
MSNRETGSDSETDSLSSIETYDLPTEVDNTEDETHIATVRNTVRDWKLREMDKNTEMDSNPSGVNGLRNYARKSARLFYDLTSYLNTSKNDEKNMKDSLYVSIVDAIGLPATLNKHVKTMLEYFLQQDLVELPYTVEPTVINAYAKKGMEAQTEFPDEE